jgi:hypothetical protein
MFFKKLGKFVSKVWIQEKNAPKNGKNGQSLQPAKLRKKEKEKENTGT